MQDHFTTAYTLRPNCTYTVNDTTYRTNRNGQIESFSGPLSRQTAPRSPSAQRNLPGKLPSEDAGHLIAASAGGSGKVDNLIRMDRQVNERDYKAFEKENRAFLAEGKEVTLTGSLAYAEGSDRPTAFMVERTVTDPVTGEVSSEHLSWTNEDMAFFDDFGEEEAYALADEFPNPGREPDYDALTDCMSAARGRDNAPSLGQANTAADTQAAASANTAGTAGASPDTAASAAASAAASGGGAGRGGSAAGSSHGGPGL